MLRTVCRLSQALQISSVPSLLMLSVSMERALRRGVEVHLCAW